MQTLIDWIPAEAGLLAGALVFIAIIGMLDTDDIWTRRALVVAYILAQLISIALAVSLCAYLIQNGG